MATSKRNLSDLLRQEAKQDRSVATTDESSTPAPQPKVDLARLTKAQLLKHIEMLQNQQPPAPTPVATEDSAIVAKNQALADQVKALEQKIVAQEQAIAKAESTIKTLKIDSTEKTKLEKALGKQQGLVDELHAQIQTLEAQQQSAERTVEQDRALVLAKISSYQVNLQFPTQPAPSISPEEIGWFD